jgi:ATP-dependent protease ClpP protease subunit
MPVKTDNTFAALTGEIGQGHEIRKPLYEQIEDQLGTHLGERVRVLAFFTSFLWPVIISDGDADMMEEVLRNTDMQGRRLFLILNSPGGDGLAAERIVNICRLYGGGQFSVIVPKMAKSAATMIAFGAKCILMSGTSELGPVDPQVPIRDEHGRLIDYQAAHEVLEAYNKLMQQASATRGRVEPFLQQLLRFDARDIRRIVSAQQLAEKIAVKSLKSGCLNALTEKAIRTKIRLFLEPKRTVSHGRPIYPPDAQRCGLDVTVVDTHCELWKSIWSLYVRLNYVVSSNGTGTAKIIESVDEAYASPAPSLGGSR